MEKINLMGHFGDAETIRERNGCTHSIRRVLTIMIVSSLCGLDTIETLAVVRLLEPKIA